MEIKAVLIDIDDTLLDFDAYVKQTMKNGFEKFGFPPYTEDMYRVFLGINTSLWHELEKGNLTFEKLKKIRWNYVLEALNIAFDGEIFEEYFRKALFFSAIPVDGALDILTYLSKKVPVFAASNGPYEQQINRLKTGNMHSYFTDFFISEKIGFSKPSFEYFDFCYKKVLETKPDVLPENIIMIGDSLSSDISGASSFGMKTCFFDKKKKGKVSDASFDFYIDSLDQIKNIL